MAMYNVKISGYPTFDCYHFERQHNKQCVHCEASYLSVISKLWLYNPHIETSKFEKQNYKVQKRRGDAPTEFMIEGPEPSKCLMIGTVNERKRATLITEMSCANDEFKMRTEALKLAAKAGGVSFFRMPQRTSVSLHALGIEQELLQILNNNEMTKDDKEAIIVRKIRDAIAKDGTKNNQKREDYIKEMKNKNQFSAWDFPALHPGRMLESYIDAWATREHITSGSTECFAKTSKLPLESLVNILEEKAMPLPKESAKICKALDMEVQEWEHVCKRYEMKEAGLPLRAYLQWGRSSTRGSTSGGTPK